MAAIPTSHVLIVAAMLVCIGTFGVLLRRNLLFMLLSLEVMLNGAALAFVGAGARWAQPDGQVFVIFVLTIAAAEAALALGLIVMLYRRKDSLDAEVWSSMREE